MLHSDANDQSTEPFQSGSQVPWQGSEGELYQEERQSRRPNEGENKYWSETPSYESPREELVQAAWQESPPLWNTSGKISVAPSVKSSARGSHSVAILALTMVIASVFGVGLFAGWTFNRNATGFLPSGNSLLTGNNIEAAREAAIAKVKPSVVQVNVTAMSMMGEQVERASGVVVDKAGYIVTNNHVIDQGEAIEVVFADGNKIENVQIAGTDPMDDLAILKIDPPANMVVATLGDSSALQVGEDVLAVGTSLGMTETTTHGIVSALNRSVPEHHGPMIPNAIQTDAPVNLGNGGGALADLQGNVIGIPTLIAIDPRFDAPADGVGFAIPINQVKRILPQIIQNGNVAHTGRAALDITSRTVDAGLQAWDDLAVSHGVYITEVDSDGPGAQAGLQQGDVIVGLAGKEVDNESTLEDVLATKAPGDKVSVNVYRGDQQLAFNVTLGELQAG
ncbi:MAG TPA: trypsin-like peptidase domain-containing protein [Ktedonobacteraceae bacterium]